MSVAVMPVVDQGEWLITHRWEMDRGESSWLQALAGFDRDQGWAVDGQLTCVDWLIWRTDMARATAFEKLRIAHQLARRSLVAAAFADGLLSYSAVRAITRIENPDPEVDAALINLAAAGTVADVERAVRCYQLHADQHRPPTDLADRRGLRIVQGYDGTTRIEITVTDLEAAEFAATLQAFLDLADRAVDESSADDTHPHPEPGRPGDNPVDESSAGDSPAASIPSRKADAFMDLVRTALDHAGDGHAAGVDRYLVHLVTHPGGTEHLDGTPIDEPTAAQVACDAATVTHLATPEGEPLALGRKTRVWSTAQRRALTVRDGGHCRFPGCWRRIADIHHQKPWTEGGPTDIGNGYLACSRHHTLLHHGFHATGDPNGTLAFHRPDGTLIATTTPTRRRRHA